MAVNQLYHSYTQAQNIIQVETDNNVTSDVYTYVPEEKETGHFMVTYNATHPASGSGANRMKMASFQMINGVITIFPPDVVVSVNAPGMDTCDFSATIVNGEIRFNVTGVAAVIRHTLIFERVSSKTLL